MSGPARVLGVSPSKGLPAFVESDDVYLVHMLDKTKTILCDSIPDCSMVPNSLAEWRARDPCPAPLHLETPATYYTHQVL